MTVLVGQFLAVASAVIGQFFGCVFQDYNIIIIDFFGES